MTSGAMKSFWAYEMNGKGRFRFANDPGGLHHRKVIDGTHENVKRAYEINGNGRFRFANDPGGAAS